MKGRWVLWILLVIVLVGGAVSLGAYAYNIGIAQGIAQNDGRLAPPATGAAPYPYYGPFFYRPFGFGFGLLGCLFPLFFIFLAFALLRGIFWGGRWGWRAHHGMTGPGVPPMFEEWHRKMHEPRTETK